MQNIWNDADVSIDMFKKFLIGAVKKGGPILQYHVIFSMGTIARLDLEQVEFTGYDSFDRYPTERIKPEHLDDIIKDNIETWHRQKNMLDGDLGKALRIAYKQLDDDGYPYPGAGSDRAPMPCSNADGPKLWNVIWMDRSPQLANLTLSDDPVRAVILSGEQRRLDCIAPKVIAVISPDLSITRVD